MCPFTTDSQISDCVHEFIIIDSWILISILSVKIFFFYEFITLSAHRIYSVKCGSPEYDIIFAYPPCYAKMNVFRDTVFNYSISSSFFKQFNWSESLGQMSNSNNKILIGLLCHLLRYLSFKLFHCPLTIKICYRLWRIESHGAQIFIFFFLFDYLSIHVFDIWSQNNRKYFI